MDAYPDLRWPKCVATSWIHLCSASENYWRPVTSLLSQTLNFEVHWLQWSFITIKKLHVAIRSGCFKVCHTLRSTVKLILLRQAIRTRFTAKSLLTQVLQLQSHLTKQLVYSLIIVFRTNFYLVSAVIQDISSFLLACLHVLTAGQKRHVRRQVWLGFLSKKDA